MSTKKMAASIIAIMMFVAIFVTTAAAYTVPNANNDRLEFEYSESNCDGLYVNERSCDRQVNIVHKTGAPDWAVIVHSENGVLTYQLYGDGTLKYDYDTLLTSYVLFVPDCETGGASGWIDGMGQPGKVLSMTGVDDISAQLGFVDDGADYNGGVYGAKIWYVPTNIVTDNSGTDYCGWDLEEMLFEEELIVLTAPTLRIYGEDSYDAAFPYTNPEAPFDPTSDEAPGKDFVVFNPAYIYEYDYDGRIAVDGGDANEKIFVRQWYVPEYPEPRGDVWHTPTTQETVYSADIVTEYSYMLLDASNMPVAGHAAMGTCFWFPIGSEGGQVGLDSFDLTTGSWDVGDPTVVTLTDIGDYNTDGMKDITIETRDAAELNDATPDEWIEFLDHRVYLTKLGMSGTTVRYADVDVYYIGNDDEELIESGVRIWDNAGPIAFGRHYSPDRTLHSLNRPWYIYATGFDIDGDWVDFKVGRRLHMNETFFVDGAEYDISMIYGPETDDFKYITIRNPTPKLEDVPLNVLSIVKEHVPECTVLPMLPPFNMDHAMVDDINLPDCYTGCPDDEACDIISDDGTDLTERKIPVGPLEVMWAEEDIEPRFHTNLLEILKEQTPEIWQWIHIHIMPDQYTEMVYPPLPDATVCNPQETLLGDFLLVSSWEAPNSCGDRMKFAYDALDSSDIYVNEQNDCGINSVRIYGEDSYDAVFPYTDPEGPFNKLSVDAPRKDFVTFNPAYIDEYDYGGRIAVDGGDANEKIFVRQWYVPEYPEPRGDVWHTPTTQETVYSADIVTEYSYMLLDASNMPVAGHAAMGTCFWFPIGSEGGQVGLDSFDLTTGSWDVGDPTVVTLTDIGDYNTDGMKDITIETRDAAELNDATPDEWIEFLDHRVYLTKLGMSGTTVRYADVDVYYIGNDDEELIESGVRIWDNAGPIAFGRHYSPDRTLHSLNRPWYIYATGFDIDGDWVDFKVGRRLHMNETFFVDGAEYDISMIYGPTGDTFKYITIRNPVPKYDEVELAVLSIVKQPVEECDGNSQTIADIIPMLPPFNMVHTIVDDIGIPHTCPTDGNGLIYGDYIQDEPIGIRGCADTVAERIVTGEPAFVSYFVEEIDEERFRTNLLEILDEDTPESWDMLCMWTLPWSYTAMVYPDVGDMLCNGVEIEDADFIVTTSGPKDAPVAECKGDFDGSGCVDFDDFVEFAGVYGSTAGDGVYNSLGDFDNDDDVDFDDFVEFAGVYGTGPNCP